MSAAETSSDDAHRVSFRVYYEDTDVSGVVYHANYLRWLERGRTEWLRDRGYGQQSLMKLHGIAFTISRITLDFLQPARLDEEVEVITTIANMRRASLEFSQRIAVGERLLLTASIRVACVDCERFRPVALPSNLSV